MNVLQAIPDRYLVMLAVIILVVLIGFALAVSGAHVGWIVGVYIGALVYLVKNKHYRKYDGG